MSSRAGEPTWTIGFALMPLALKAARAASTMRAARRQSFARCTRCFGPTPGATHSKSISRSGTQDAASRRQRAFDPSVAIRTFIAFSPVNSNQAGPPQPRGTASTVIEGGPARP